MLAARVRALAGGNAAQPTADVFALVRAAPPRELPVCVLDALEGLEERRFTRRGRD